MKDQFADLPWYLQPGAWPYWPTPPLTGPSTTQGGPWPQGSPSTVANSSGGLLGSLVRPASGILGSLARPVEEPTAAINGPLAWGLGTMPSVFFPAQPQNIWTRGIPSQAPLGLNYPAAVHASDKLDPRDNAGGAATPNAQTPPLARPSVPLSGADNGSSSPEPALPEPPKDFRTWLLDALSDQNVRYYAGPHLYEALRKLHALTQVLPGSGTVQSTQDASRAGEEAQAGNYGKAAAHFGMGTVNAALDWLPPAKLAILGGMMARTFPWERLPTALEMEAAGKSAQKIWQEAGLERNAAGNWVFNIPDKGYRIRPRAGEPTMWPPLTHAPLYEHHVHPGMQEAYPGLADTQSFLSVAPHERPYGEQPSLRPGNSSGAESWRGQERRHPRAAAFGRPAREASSWRVAALFQ